ncbi:MAG TPA: hypothetical protein PK360_19470 [bacterium]|nr:hypothetical protein [bacterium]
MKRIPTLRAVFILGGLFLSLAGPAGAAERPLVIEEFTGTWCVFCFGVGMALDRIHEAYPRDEILVAEYHYADPYSIVFGESRVDFYEVPGFPTVVIDGIAKFTGGSPLRDGEAGIALLYEKILSLIEEEQARLADTVSLRLYLEGTTGPDDPRLRLTIQNTAGYPHDIQVVFLITEDEVEVPPVQALNGKLVYNSLVRAHLGTETVNLAAPGSLEVQAAYPGAIPHQSPENLHPVVFLQDAKTKEILGAVGVFNRPVPVPDWSLHP